MFFMTGIMYINGFMLIIFMYSCCVIALSAFGLYCCMKLLSAFGAGQFGIISPKSTSTHIATSAHKNSIVTAESVWLQSCRTDLQVSQNLVYAYLVQLKILVCCVLQMGSLAVVCPLCLYTCVMVAAIHDSTAVVMQMLLSRADRIYQILKFS